LYAVWIKIDETLPWIELKGEWQTYREAKRTAEETMKSIGIKIVKLPQARERIKVCATARTTR
jgi:hypothetical protein